MLLLSILVYCDISASPIFAYELSMGEILPGVGIPGSFLGSAGGCAEAGGRPRRGPGMKKRDAAGGGWRSCFRWGFKVGPVAAEFWGSRFVTMALIVQNLKTISLHLPQVHEFPW